MVTSDQSACDVCVVCPGGVQRPVSASGHNGWLGLFKVKAAFTPIGDAGDCQLSVVCIGREEQHQQAATLCICKEPTSDSEQGRRRAKQKKCIVDFQGQVHSPSSGARFVDGVHVVRMVTNQKRILALQNFVTLTISSTGPLTKVIVVGTS